MRKNPLGVHFILLFSWHSRKAVCLLFSLHFCIGLYPRCLLLPSSPLRISVECIIPLFPLCHFVTCWCWTKMLRKSKVATLAFLVDDEPWLLKHMVSGSYPLAKTDTCLPVEHFPCVCPQLSDWQVKCLFSLHFSPRFWGTEGFCSPERVLGLDPGCSPHPCPDWCQPQLIYLLVSSKIINLDLLSIAAGSRIKLSFLSIIFPVLKS